MKSLRRRMFNFAAGGSLLLGVLVAGMWVRSYWGTDTVQFVRADRSSRLTLVSVAGRTCWVYSRGDPLWGWTRFPTGWKFQTSPPMFLEQAFNGEFVTAGVAGFNLVQMDLAWIKDGDSLNALSQPRSFLEPRRRPAMPSPAGAVVEHRFFVVIPYWIMLLVALPLPASWLIRQIRGRVLPGYCRRCGYDLRATPDRCPECGTVATTVQV